MSQQELLKKVVHALNEIGVEYMMTGSVVSSLQGEPRSTHDIDLVVVIRNTDISKLVESFPLPDYYLDKDSILDAIESRTMFSLIDVQQGYKVDFWMLTGDPFDQSRFYRKYVEEVLGFKLNVSTPEDTILMKLRWADLSGGSEKQFTDALRVYEIQGSKLDLPYIEQWADQIGIRSLWERLKSYSD